MNDPSRKAWDGNYFEDFSLGQNIRHATPRTVTHGDVSLYIALTGSRFALNSAGTFAASLGLPRAPLDDLLVFHMVFGKTVPDVSRNAVANLGYAECVFGAPAYPGDTLSAMSRVIGLKENSNGRTGTVYVRTTGRNQNGETVVEFVRWVMVAKRDAASPAPAAEIPALSEKVATEALIVPVTLKQAAYDGAAAGSAHAWEDYRAGERIDHGDGLTIEAAEHMMAAKLYQNTARAHFDQHLARDNRFGKRIVYGGHIISLARALSFNGLANAVKIAAINGGRHVAPCFAGDTVYASTEVIETAPLPGRDDFGAARLRTIATRDQPCAAFPYKSDAGKYHPSVLLDLDTTVLIPRSRMLAPMRGD